MYVISNTIKNLNDNNNMNSNGMFNYPEDNTNTNNQQFIAIIKGFKNINKQLKILMNSKITKYLSIVKN